MVAISIPISMSTASPNPSSLPECVERVLMHIQWLDDAVRAPFPVLHVAPTSPADARRLVAKAVAWGAGIKEACERQSYPNCVTKDGESLRFGLFETSMIGGGLVYPRDVMGLPPDSLREACHADALTALGRGGPNDLESDGRNLLDDWPSAASMLEQAHAVIGAHATEVVRWARSKAERIADRRPQARTSDGAPEATRAGGQHPLQAELLLFVEQMYRPFCRDKIQKWIFLGTGSRFRVETFDGSVIDYSGLKFEGTPRQTFWQGFAEPFLKDMIRKGVEHAVRLADERGFGRADALREVRGILRSRVEWAYRAMTKVEINQLNRDRQFILSRKLPPIQWTDTTPMVARMHAFVDEIIAGWPEHPTRASGKPEVGPPAARANARRRRPKALTDSERECLVALLQLGAVDRARRRSSRQVALRSRDGENVPLVKDALGSLVARKLANSEGGRHGGYWLTSKGIARAKRLSPPTD